MAYTKTTWAAGDTVTSTKLNKIEQGIYDASNSGGVFYINGTVDLSSELESISNVTGQQILDAVDAGKIVAIKVSSGNVVSEIVYFYNYEIDNNSHYFHFYNRSSKFSLYASSLSANLSVYNIPNAV